MIFSLIYILLSSLTIAFAGEEFSRLNSFFGIATVFFAFSSIGGYADKIYQIIRAKCTGNQSLTELVLHFIKDLSGIFYGLYIDINQSWPLIISMSLLSVVGTVNIGVYVHYNWKSSPS